MKRHIIILIVAFVLFVALLLGARSLDSRIAMPLLGGGPTIDIEDPIEPINPVMPVDPDADAVAAAHVDALIAAISSPVTLESESAILAARDAYNVLPDGAKELVQSLPTLEAAEAELDALVAGLPEPGESDQLESGATGLQPGDQVTFTGGNIYVSPTSTTPANTIPGASNCTVTYLSEDVAHPYHLISDDDGGVYGWVDADSVQKA